MEVEVEVGAGAEADTFCVLCFVDGDAWFQGRIIDGQRRQTGLLGRRIPIPEDRPFHQCCFSKAEPPVFFEVTVIDFHAAAEADAERVISPVLKSNGDNAKLEHDEFAFVTTIFCAGDEADEWALKYFPKLLRRGRELLICVGDLELGEDPTAKPASLAR